MMHRYRNRAVGCRALIASGLLLAGFSGRLIRAQGEATMRPAADTGGRNHTGVARDSADTASHTGETESGPRRTVDPVTEAAREYARTGIARVVEEGAFETFPYGHGQPTLTCAPLRACVIELGAGESVLSRIAGDTQRWEIELAPAGADGRTALVVVKPHDCGLTTNLVLTTTAGRIYDLTLDSPPCMRGGTNPHGIYVRHVRFYYPDATVQTSALPPAPAVVHAHASASGAEGLNFGYRSRRTHHFPWTPVAVFDDAVHCYIKLPPHAAHGDAPVLFALADDGSRVLLNYSLTNETYVTDRVFRSAELVIGEPGSERVLRIDNLHYDVTDPADGTTPSSAAPGQGGASQ
jgi:P-type conjugative transfer protein TrbG